MPSLKFGLHFDGMIGVPGYGNPFDFAKRLEDLGLDSFWCGESPNDRGYALDQIAVLSYAAAATSRITIGGSIVLLPLHHPGWVAKRWGTISLLSNGRTIMGVGPGGEFPKQFDLFGVDVKERGRRTDESIVAVRKLWTEPCASHDGPFFPFHEIKMEPRPEPSPPIWVGGRPGGTAFDANGRQYFKSKTGAIKRAGVLGDGWFPYYMTTTTYRDSVERVGQCAADAGRTLEPFTWALVTNMFLRQSREDALREATERLRHGRHLGERVAQYDLIGTADDIANRIGEYADVGVQHFVIHVQSRPGELWDDIERLAKDIAPGFKR
jgi:alkanesulfonate monooxygenase SsuD/methylene tetrahydromethanopterin reductase-like flavin-dependent oxidoreductase (luciferase family)